MIAKYFNASDNQITLHTSFMEKMMATLKQKLSKFKNSHFISAIEKQNFLASTF